MDPGVIVHVVVDAVAPRVAPSVRLEQVLDHRRRVMTPIEMDRASIDDERPPRMVGNETVILEADVMRVPRPREVRGFPFSGSPEAGGALGILLQVLKNRHDHPPGKLRTDSRSKIEGAARGWLRARIPRRRRSPSAPKPRPASARDRPRAPGSPGGARLAKRQPRTPAHPCALRGRKEKRPRACRKRKCRGRARSPFCGPVGSGRIEASARVAAARRRPRPARRGCRRAAAPRYGRARRASPPPPEPEGLSRPRPRSGRARTPPEPARCRERWHVRLPRPPGS